MHVWVEQIHSLKAARSAGYTKLENSTSTWRLTEENAYVYIGGLKFSSTKISYQIACEFVLCSRAVTIELRR